MRNPFFVYELGSERSIDSLHHNAQRLKEAAQINASLMSLKGCILARAAGKDASHQYRKSKLTMVLKPSFFLKDSQTTILATVSPSSKDTEHSLNTLRHACIMNGNGQVVDDRVEVANCGEVVVQQIGRINVYEERQRQAAEQKKHAASAGSGSFSRDTFKSNGNESGERFGEVLTDRQLEKMRKKSERKAIASMTPNHKVLLLAARSADNAHKQKMRAWQQRQVAVEAAGEAAAAADDTRHLKYGGGGGSSVATSKKAKKQKAKEQQQQQQQQQQQRYSKWDEPYEGGGGPEGGGGGGGGGSYSDAAVESHGSIPLQTRGSRRSVHLGEVVAPTAPPPGSPKVSRHDRAKATRERIAAEKKEGLLAARDRQERGSAGSTRSGLGSARASSRGSSSRGSSSGGGGGGGGGGGKA